MLAFLVAQTLSFLPFRQLGSTSCLQLSYMQAQRLFKMAAEQVLDGVFGMLRPPS